MWQSCHWFPSESHPMKQFHWRSSFEKSAHALKKNVTGAWKIIASIKKKEKSRGPLCCRCTVGRYFKIRTPELNVRATSGQCPGAVGLGLDTARSRVEIVSTVEGIYGKAKIEGEGKWDGGNETAGLFKCAADRSSALEECTVHSR